MCDRETDDLGGDTDTTDTGGDTDTDDLGGDTDTDDLGGDTDTTDTGGDTDTDDPPLTETEREALHSVELGVEWLHRAHGDLVGFHHKTGHAMDHFAAAETKLRECGYTDLADTLRDEYLPRGVLEDRWSYDVLETYQEGFLSEMSGLEKRACRQIADGQRHVVERETEREWKGRASER